MKITFDIISRSQNVKYVCLGCGKKRTKVIKVEHTINPYNKNKDGIPKTRNEVLEDVCTELKRRVTKTEQGITCSKCNKEPI